MRVLFVSHYGPSHVPWLVPLAWAAQLAGHDVRFAVQPQSAPTVREAGLIAVPIGDESVARRPENMAGLGKKMTTRLPDRWSEKPELGDKEFAAALAQRLFTVADGVLDDLVAFARAWRPALVVHDSASVAAVVAAGALGVPAVGHVHGMPGGMFVEKKEDLLKGYVRLFERFGLEPFVGRPVWIDPYPRSLRWKGPVTQRPMRFIPWSGSAEVPDWLEGGQAPRVCVTGGLTTSEMTAVLGPVIDALTGSGVEVVLALSGGQAAEVRGQGLLRDGVRVLESFPLNALMPTCRAVVQHGGAGSTMIALAHGLPQLVLPASPIQQDWARRVTEAGAGLTVDLGGAGPDTAALGEAVGALLETASLRKEAGRLREEIESAPLPGELVGFLESIAGR
ncbi:nucleotide disphospho-sugar-binding domain-containing protein [Streptomyces inhibens]|uniref:nucleotide disphospho-sugar-binding domain-containing protein n=1 Tax=Streptomyces inhibens TaxID=2293571 RepID=UPI001EE74A99|nr:nucleotide disphospho-sugar-binding domain-containing protein [Streptomyces inhibens]UKY51783.1 DUF1205 domain-containing protein [Streptomyces inhibens]